VLPSGPQYGSIVGISPPMDGRALHSLLPSELINTACPEGQMSSAADAAGAVSAANTARTLRMHKNMGP